jgi:hypothetical protein
MSKYSYDSLVYFGEPVDRSIARLARICSIFTAERDLASPDENGRAKTVDYVKHVADLALPVTFLSLAVLASGAQAAEGGKAWVASWTATQKSK